MWKMKTTKVVDNPAKPGKWPLTEVVVSTLASYIFFIMSIDHHLQPSCSQELNVIHICLIKVWHIANIQ